MYLRGVGVAGEANDVGAVAPDARPNRPWAWPTVAIGVLIFTSSAVGAGDLDVRTLARAGGQSALGMLLIGIGGAALRPRPIRETLRVGRSHPRVSGPELAVWVVGLLALSVALDRAMEALGVREGSRLADLEAVLTGLQLGDVAVAVAGIAIAPAIAEEIVFRGLLLGALLLRLPAWAAVGLSALLFGAAHLDLVHGAAAGVLGLYLGVVALATGSVRAAIVAHAGNNAFALLAPAAAGGLEGRPIVVAIVALCLALGLGASVFTLARRLRERPAPPP